MFLVVLANAVGVDSGQIELKLKTKYNLYDCLSEAFNDAGYETRSNGEFFKFLPLNLAIEPELIAINSFENKQCSCSARLTFSNPDKFQESITEYTMGIGDSDYEAIKNAFQRWVDCDFPPIHDYSMPDHAALGKSIESVSFSGELNNYIGWDVYFGPLLETKEIENNLQTVVNDTNSNLIFQKLFQPLTDAVFGTPGTYFIRAFMSVSSDNLVDSDCRVNGVDWQLGNEYLNEYISSIDKKNQTYFLKQSFILNSKPIEEIRSATLRQKLDDQLSKLEYESSKRWWEFWKK